jgi:cell fate (sporulation/competence/biofilm development) regulator YlbF (YheA/YmcA/DUF963 family)
MIRQERRRKTREYQKELDKLNKIASKLYKQHGEDNKKIADHMSALTDGICENKGLQAYFNLMADLSQRMTYLQREITKLNDN